jgi:ABC-type uncharacterized transport system auxiliary subunit
MRQHPGSSKQHGGRMAARGICQQKETTPMRNNAILIYVALICLLPVIGGCVGPQTKRLDIAFYHVYYPAPEPVVNQPVAANIAVGTFKVMPPFDTHRIIYATGPVVYDAYVYHQWFNDPSDMISGLFYRDIRNAGIFQAVGFGDDRLADYRLTGIVESFLERDHDHHWEAVLSVTITLVEKTQRRAAEQVLFQKNYTSVQLSARKHPQALADAMSMAVADVSMQIINDIHKAVL